MTPILRVPSNDIVVGVVQAAVLLSLLSSSSCLLNSWNLYAGVVRLFNPSSELSQQMIGYSNTGQ